jgi:hypothetical protein
MISQAIRGTSRTAFSQVAAALLTIVLVGAAVSALFIASAPHPTVSSSSSASSSTTSSPSPSTTATTMSSSSVTAFTTTVTTNTTCETTTNGAGTNSSTVGSFCEGLIPFGDGETPSGMLIPANTLTWVPLVFDTNASAVQNNFMTADVNVFLYSDYSGMNITVGVYGAGGNLINSDPGGLPSNYCNQVPCASEGASPSGSPNQVVSIPNWPNKAAASFPADPYNLTLRQGSTFYVAFVSDRPIWVGGFSAADRSGGSGLQYGQSPWEAPVTYEGTMGQQQNAVLPNDLPSAALSSSFEISVSGNVGLAVE